MKDTLRPSVPSGEVLCLKTLPTLENDHFDIPGEIRYALLKKLLLLPGNARLEYDFSLCSDLPETASFGIEFTMADGSVQALNALPTEEAPHAAPLAQWKRITIDLGILAGLPVREICLVYHTRDLTTVEVPAGTYRIAEHLVVPSGVTLRGVGEKSLLLAENSRDRFHGPSLLTLEGSASVSGLAIYYPEQDNRALVPYPYTITCQEGNYSLLEDLTLYNSYNGIRIGTAVSHHVRVKNVRMTALHHGFTADCSDDLQVSGLTVSPAVWMESPYWPETNAEDADAFCKALNLYLDAVAFGSCPNCTVKNVTVSWAKSGLQCSETTQVSMWSPRRPTFPHGPTGRISGLQIDHAALGLELNYLSGNLSVSQGSIQASGGYFPLAVRVSKAIRHGLTLEDLTFASDGGCMEVITHRASISVNSCRFTRWAPDYFCIDTEYPSISLEHSEFARAGGQLMVRNPDGICPTDA